MSQTTSRFGLATLLLLVLRMSLAAFIVVDGLLHEIFARLRYKPSLLNPPFHAYLRVAHGQETPAKTVGRVKSTPSGGNRTYPENKLTQTMVPTFVS
jgi:hypothetical protein